LEQREKASGRRFGWYSDAVLSGSPSRAARSQTFAMQRKRRSRWGCKMGAYYQKVLLPDKVYLHSHAIVELLSH